MWPPTSAEILADAAGRVTSGIAANLPQCRDTGLIRPNLRLAIYAAAAAGLLGQILLSALLEKCTVQEKSRIR